MENRQTNSGSGADTVQRPPYQRGYVWDEAHQREPLWSNVTALAESELEAPHFMRAGRLRDVARTFGRSYGAVRNRAIRVGANSRPVGGGVSVEAAVSQGGYRHRSGSQAPDRAPTQQGEARWRYSTARAATIH